MEQHILFQGYSPPNSSRVIPLWKFLLIFHFCLNPPTVYIQSSWNFINSYMMMWSSAYYFEVTMYQILTELCPFENFYQLFCFWLTPPTVYIQSSWNFINSYMMMCSSKYYLEQGSKLTVASSKFATWKFSLLRGKTIGSKKFLPGIVPWTLSTLCCECPQCKLGLLFHVNCLLSRQFTCMSILIFAEVEKYFENAVC